MVPESQLPFDVNGDYIFPTSATGVTRPAYAAGSPLNSGCSGLAPGSLSFWGYYGDYAGSYQVTVSGATLVPSAVPEPSALVGLLALGGLGAVSLRRQKTTSLR